MLACRFPGDPRLRYVEEPRPSAARARNAGLATATGEIVAFTDDDVVVDPLWLRVSVEGLLAAPNIGCVTGLIVPLELHNDSQLLLEQFAGFGKGFERKSYCLPEARRENPLLPYAAGALGSGASMVMPAEVGRALGGFDPALGPATAATGGEDLDLLVRILRHGYGLVYEPKAIVWHEHPVGRARLRRQVYRYGVGLGAMLGKQLLRGSERREMVRALPAAVRYLRDPSSRKNLGKPTTYPRHLTWLERLGMVVGPLAYLLSLATVRRDRSATSAPSVASPHHAAKRVVLGDAPSPRSPSITLMRRLVVNGQPGNGDARAVAPAQFRFAWRRGVERAATASPDPFVLATAIICALAALFVVVNAPVAVRAPAVLAMLCLAPGTAWLSAARGRLEPGLVLGISAGAVGLLAQSMLWLDAWSPRLWLYAVAAGCLVPLAARLGRTGVDWRGTHLWRVLHRRGRPLSLASASGAHVALVAVALLTWAVSLTSTDLGQINGVGLLAALPFTYYLALGALLAGFVAAVTTADAPRWLLGAYVLALVVVIHATTPLLYDAPRYAWTYPHFGVTSLIATTGHADRQVDIYNNWPAFFALNAWFSRTAGVTPIVYAAWAQLFFNVFNVLAIRFALRALTRDERLLWTAALLFVLGNWVGQDYLAPQAYAFALTVVVLGLCLHCGRQRLSPRYGLGRWAAHRMSPFTRRLPATAPGVEGEAPPISPVAALATGGACVVAIVTSHQLSPVILTLSVALYAVVTRKIPLWIPLGMAAVELWWVALAWPFLHTHFSLIDPGGGGAAAPARDIAAAPTGAVLSFYAPAAVMAAIAATAVVGTLRRLREGSLDLAPVCLIAAPVGTVLVQSYGGEGPYRAYLFALPWLALLGAFACTRGRSRRGAVRMSRARLTVVATVVSAGLLFAYFGQELAYRVPSDDVRASLWYERHGPAGSIRIDLAPNAPNRLTARYPLVDLSDPSSLVETQGFTGHRLGVGDVRRLIILINRQRARPAYVVLSRGQENYARLNGLLPAGSLTSFAHALARSRAFRLVYRHRTALIFEYRARGSR
jgi:hypothetical protein